MRIGPIKSGTFLCVCVAAMLHAVPSYAGFEWLPDGQTPYSDTPTPKPTMSIPSTPSAVSGGLQGGSGIFLPLPGQGQSPNATTVTPSPRYSSPAINRAAPPVNTPPAVNKYTPEFQTSMPSLKENVQPPTHGVMIRDNGNPAVRSSSRFPAVEGFGNEIPLAMALRQVVPADYAYAFGNGVNPGYRVSWNGGKPWNEIVFDMIAPLDLVAYVRGNKLYINKRTSTGEKSMVMDAQASGSAMVQNSSMSQSVMDVSTPQAVPVPPPIAPLPIMGGNTAIYSPNNYNSAAQIAKKGPQNQEGFVSLEGGRSNILDPGLHRRSQTAKTMNKIKQWTNIDKYIDPQETKLTDVDTRIGMPVQSPIRPVITEPVLPPPPQKFAYQTDLMENVNQPAAWQARQGDSLFGVLGRWTETANVKLIWNARDDYLVANDVFVNGPFPQALEDLVTNGVMSGHRPAVDFYETPSEDHIGTLVIKDR